MQCVFCFGRNHNSSKLFGNVVIVYLKRFFGLKKKLLHWREKKNVLFLGCVRRPPSDSSTKNERSIQIRSVYMNVTLHLYNMSRRFAFSFVFCRIYFAVEPCYQITDFFINSFALSPCTIHITGTEALWALHGRRQTRQLCQK